MRRTKIVCTIGPASNSEKVMNQMIKAGMNVARLNFSHGAYIEHEKVINLIRKISKKSNNPITIIQDLQGPRIRLGKLPEHGYVLQPKEKVILVTKASEKFTKGDLKSLTRVPVTYDKMHLDVKTGQRILMVDGLIELEVKKVSSGQIECQVKKPGLINTHKGINLPDTILSIPTITTKDKKDLDFGIKNDVDYVAMSFVRSAKDVIDLRKLIAEFSKKYRKKKNQLTKIIVKIERQEAVDNIDKIIDQTDGVMIARGDLGIELPASSVPLIQKMIIEKCLLKAKPVIVATQLLDSMISSVRPTRAEVSDVANAVIDHTDAVMLSGETAIGKYPVEVIKTMSEICINTEKSKYDDLDFKRFFKHVTRVDQAVSSSANILAKNLDTEVILVASLSGHSGRIVSRYRPELPILVITDNEKVRRQLNLSWGVISFVIPKCKTIEELVNKAISYTKKKKYIKKNDKIVIVAGFPLGKSGNINWIEIQKV